MTKVKMEYRGESKRVKLPSGLHTADRTEMFMVADVKTGDIAEFEDERTLQFVKLARCQDGSSAWVNIASAADVTVTFTPIQPKAPSRRTSWKSRGGRAKK